MVCFCLGREETYVRASDIETSHHSLHCWKFWTIELYVLLNFRIPLLWSFNNGNWSILLSFHFSWACFSLANANEKIDSFGFAKCQMLVSFGFCCCLETDLTQMGWLHQVCWFVRWWPDLLVDYFFGFFTCEKMVLLNPQDSRF